MKPFVQSAIYQDEESILASRVTLQRTKRASPW